MTTQTAAEPARLKVGTRVQVRSCDANFREVWEAGVIVRDPYRASWLAAHRADPARTPHPNALPMVKCERDPMSGGGRWPIALVRVVDNRALSTTVTPALQSGAA